MSEQIRIPYYRPDLAGFFALARVWRLVAKAEGCKPLNHPQAAILMERKPPLLPGEKPAQAVKTALAKPGPKQTGKGAQANKAGALSSSANIPEEEKTAQSVKPSSEKASSDWPMEECKTPPPFDMLDLPNAMDKMGFPVASRLAKRWFNSRKHEIPAGAEYVYPNDMVDTKIVSLDFVLKHSKVRTKYDNLVRSGIYSDRALKVVKDRLGELLARKFIDDGLAYSGALDVFAHVDRDIQKLHAEFQFQREVISNFDTLDRGYGLTDLTAALANFVLYAAIAELRVRSEKYYNYPKGAAPVYCCQSHVELTHIYIYARDSYSFADKPGKKAS